MKATVGIDLGSSSVKLSLISEEGQLIQTAERPYATQRPRKDWEEIDPEIWWCSTLGALEELCSQASDLEIVGMGVTGQMHTTVFVDEDGKSVRPAIMWSDGRTADMVEPARKMFAELGLVGSERIVSTGSPALNLAWLVKHEPESVARVRRFLIGPDWIVYRLTGALGTDCCEASTSSLFDFDEGSWSERACAELGIPASWCPEIRGSACVAGTLLPELAKRLGLSPAVEIVAGTGDNPAAAIPTGCLTEGKPVLSLGTSCVLMFSRPEPDFSARGKNILISFDGDKVQTLVQGVIQSCGSSRTWLDLNVLGYDSHVAADAEAPEQLMGSNPVMFYPHLAGEKTLFSDPSLRGAFLGLSPATTRGELVLALMEGIAFGVRQLVEETGLSIDPEEGLQVIGGGSKSDVWMQALADVLGVRTLRMRGAASAGYGAALLSLAATCGRDLEDACKQAVSVDKVFAPREDRQNAYSAQYERYLRMHDALVSIDAPGANGKR